MTILTTRDLPDADPATVSAAVQEACRRISTGTAGPQRLVRWNDGGYVALAVTLDVDLPCEGPVDGVDIRAREPVAFVFPPSYPGDVPRVRSDRADFPAARLPHLNPVQRGQPACFCLHRGNLADWLAEHTVEDLVERVRHWLRDAAAGLLQREVDGFEATRIVGSDGSIVAPYAKLDAVADADPAGGHAYFLSTMPVLTKDRVGSTGFSLECTFGDDQLATWVDLCLRYNKLVLQSDKIASELWTVGVIMWGAAHPIDTYLESHPGTIAELQELLDPLGIAVDRALAQGADSLQFVFDIPVLAGILRPRKVIGHDGRREWLGFLLPHREGGIPNEGSAVRPLLVRRPLDPAFARTLSGDLPLPGPAVLLGCGALGSKMAMHLARSGCLPLRLVDSATIAPHNAVRYGLTSVPVGANKADAVKAAITTMYPHTPDLAVIADDRSAGRAVEDLNEPQLVIDATASTAVAQYLATHALPVGSRVVRCEIGASGTLGFASSEGADRNPRIDDLQFATYDAALDREELSRWLVAERGRAPTEFALEEIELGFGCSSDTVRCPDENVSIHAAQFVRELRRAPAVGGRVVCVNLSDGGVCTSAILVPPVTVLASRGWNVRVSRAVVEVVERGRRSSGIMETGGLLLGYCHLARKTMYVTRALPASRDSVGTPARFDRGVVGMPGAVQSAELRTGGLIGYVGEWHTHPTGSADASATDREAALTLLRDLRGARIPALLLIGSRREIKAHVYHSEATP